MRVGGARCRRAITGAVHLLLPLKKQTHKLIPLRAVSCIPLCSQLPLYIREAFLQTLHLVLVLLDNHLSRCPRVGGRVNSPGCRQNRSLLQLWWRRCGATVAAVASTAMAFAEVRLQRLDFLVRLPTERADTAAVPLRNSRSVELVRHQGAVMGFDLLLELGVLLCETLVRLLRGYPRLSHLLHVFVEADVHLGETFLRVDKVLHHELGKLKQV